MKTLFRMAFCVVMLAGWSLAALSLYVVRTPDWIALIPKAELGVRDTYVDTRNWTLKDCDQHPEVVERILQSGKASILRHVTGKSGDDLESKLADAAKKGEAERADRRNKMMRVATTGTAAADGLRSWSDLLPH